MFESIFCMRVWTLYGREVLYFDWYDFLNEFRSVAIMTYNIGKIFCCFLLA